ncbi:dihydrofolate reductase [Derxia gummosa]|uniref:Dihydrofolate reductase n=1 Tax=Derxia gummosa DSM 723 TaxID=1121388 RepID=A0A8B6X100_9BURK|nr:dihydrofolate reductase [Derxia gummosa]
MTTLSVIVAVARNGIIGRDNTLPWRLPADLKHFRATTMGAPIVMGRNTWESLGRPLPGRRHIVVSRNRDYVAAGAEVVASLDAALALVAEVPEVFVIGGAQLYALAFPRAQRFVITEVALEPEGDTRLPPLPAGLVETSRETHPADAETGAPAHAFVEYRRG